MWHPKQLLKESIINALFVGGFTKLQIEFLGWMSGTATALNRSKNPVKAAHTLLARIGDPEEGMTKLWDKFEQRKLESIKPPDAETHEVADAAFRRLDLAITESVEYARIEADGYQDFTKGGVSDGGMPLGDEEDQEEAEPGVEVPNE